MNDATLQCNASFLNCRKEMILNVAPTVTHAHYLKTKIMSFYLLCQSLETVWSLKAFLHSTFPVGPIVVVPGVILVLVGGRQVVQEHFLKNKVQHYEIKTYTE